MVGSEQMADLLGRADAAGAKVVLEFVVKLVSHGRSQVAQA